MQTVEKFTVVKNGQWTRLAFERANGKVEESSFYSEMEADEVICNWKAGQLLGSFAIGTVLSESAEAVLDLA